MELENEILYVFDTNAIYDYYESDDSNSMVYGKKFRDYFKDKFKVIPSISLMEIFVKKRNNPKYIREIIQMIVNENFNLSNSQFVAYNLDDLLKVYQMEEFLIIMFCNNQLEKKIELESEILSLMEYYISVQFAGTTAQKYGIDAETGKITWTKIVCDLLPLFQKRFRETLKKGYTDRDEKDAAKNLWKAIMFTNFKFINDNTFAVAEVKGTTNGKAWEKQSLTKKIRDVILGTDANKDYFQIMQKANVSNYPNFVNDDIDICVDSIKNCKKDFTDIQCGYLRHMLYNWIFLGEALDKNDTSNLQYFYFGSINSLESLRIFSESQTLPKKENIWYISFDSDMYSYINEMNPTNYRLFSSYIKNPKLKY